MDSVGEDGCCACETVPGSEMQTLLLATAARLCQGRRRLFRTITITMISLNELSQRRTLQSACSAYQDLKVNSNFSKGSGHREQANSPYRNKKTFHS